MSADLKIILCEGENYTVEFKETPDKSLPAEVCAFANASGGKILIGVNDKGVIVGTETSNIARSRIQDTINKIEPRLNVSLEVIDNIIVLTVPEGVHKPYSCPSGFYLRSGPNSQKMARNSIEEFFQNEGRVRYDAIVREDLPIVEKFHETAYKRFIKIAKISEVLEREEILKNLNCAKVIGGKLYFTNVGALFFRKNDEDVEFRYAGIACALYKGTKKVYILDAKEFNDDIVSNLDNALVFLKRHLRLKYVIKTLQREEILELPEDALREAVINAVCHRDYFEKGARTTVEIFDDRVEITNPGGLCKGITAENFGTLSISRNSLVTNLFYRLGYIEQMGTGIERMKNATRALHVADPEFELSGFFKITFKRDTSYLTDTASGSQEEVKRKSRGSQAEAKADRRDEILSIMKENNRVTSAELADNLNLTQRRIRTLLGELVQEGIIEKIGNDRHTYYVLKQ